MLRIVAAALKKGGDVFFVSRPGRHGDVFALLARHGIAPRGVVQGFLDSEGRFQTRRDAARIAYDAGQFPRHPVKCPPTLISEDLW